ncbi:MAG: MBL fold metallo-hydrolase [Myxococcota bacterium]
MRMLEVEFISHATLKIRGEFGTLLCDPWFLNEPVYNLSTWKFPAATIPPNQVAEGVDYLYITHSHEDHFHLPSLDYIDRDVQVLLPAYDDHPSLRAYTVETVLRGMGFANIRRIRSWETVTLGETPLTVIPAADSRDHDWENSGFLLEHHDSTLLNMNDNVNDEKLCREIHERWPSIDIAFVQSGGVTMYPGCFKMSEAEMRKVATERKLAFREQRRLIELLQPRYVAPFAGDFCWLSEAAFHNNWANRTTPALFSKMVEAEYPEVKVVLLYPGDQWSQAGHVRNHREIDWENVLDEMEALQTHFRPKIEAIEAYLRDVDLERLEARSRERAALVEKWITRDWIDFECRFRISVSGPQAGFSFVLAADPEAGFSIDFTDRDPVTQTLHVPQHIWASILEGKLLWNIIQWVGVAEQHVEYTADMGRFWFWLEYHVDLNSANIQALLDERLIPSLGRALRPTYATFPLEGEWELREPSPSNAA